MQISALNFTHSEDSLPRSASVGLGAFGAWIKSVETRRDAGHLQIAPTSKAPNKGGKKKETHGRLRSFTQRQNEIALCSTGVKLKHMLESRKASALWVSESDQNCSSVNYDRAPSNYPVYYSPWPNGRINWVIVLAFCTFSRAQVTEIILSFFCTAIVNRVHQWTQSDKSAAPEDFDALCAYAADWFMWPIRDLNFGRRAAVNEMEKVLNLKWARPINLYFLSNMSFIIFTTAAGWPRKQNAERGRFIRFMHLISI